MTETIRHYYEHPLNKTKVFEENFHSYFAAIADNVGNLPSNTYAISAEINGNEICRIHFIEKTIIMNMDFISYFNNNETMQVFRNWGTVFNFKFRVI